MHRSLTSALLVVLAIAGSAWAINPLTVSNGRVTGLISPTTNSATAGICRFGSTDNLCWRDSINTTNYCFSLNANDVFQMTAGLRVTDQNNTLGNFLAFYGNGSGSPPMSCAVNGVPKGLAIMDTSLQNTDANRVWQTCYGQVNGPSFPQNNSGVLVTSTTGQTGLPPSARFALATAIAAHFVEGLE